MEVREELVTLHAFCGGSGLMADPQYQNQKAYEYGKALGLCGKGQAALVHGNYKEAFDAFEEAMKLENAEAMFLSVFVVS